MDLRQCHLRGALGRVRVVQHDGREHLVVPIVALMEGVIHAVNAATPERVTTATLTKAAQSWNGRPLMVGHPMRNGRQISANEAEVLATQSVGTIFNSRMSGTKLLMDAYVDTAKAQRIGASGLLDRLRNGEMCEVSVGAFVTTDDLPGDWYGKPYKATWLETTGDHLALLPDSRGACSIEMGCGAHRAAAELPEFFDMTEAVAELVALGGPGSGNFDHAGRPGMVGGSSDGGGSGGSAGASDKGEWRSEGGFEHTGIEWKQPVGKDGRPIPIKVKTIEEAAAAVLAGKVVEVADVRTAHTLIAKLHDQAQAMKARGEKAPDYDLCKVTVPGSSMFCAESLRTKEYPEGVPRLEMPQIGGYPIAGSEADKLPRSNPFDKEEVDGSKVFIAHLQSIGVKTEHLTMPASDLRASQRELVGPKVAAIMTNEKFDPSSLPIFISSDNYIVDGHHRWAAVVGRDAADGSLGSIKMKVMRVNAPISEVLHLANAWSRKFGIKQVAGVTKQAAATGLQKSKRALSYFAEGASMNDDLETLGGAGSGNFGHAGRPGAVGGSASGGGMQGPVDKGGGGGPSGKSGAAKYSKDKESGIRSRFWRGDEVTLPNGKTGLVQAVYEGRDGKVKVTIGSLGEERPGPEFDETALGDKRGDPKPGLHGGDPDFFKPAPGHKYESADHWANEFSMKQGSAIDIWMGEADKEKLFKIVKAGGKVKAFSADMHYADENSQGENLREKWVDRHTARMKAKGYTLFADEDNSDSHEIVFVKKAPKKLRGAEGVTMENRELIDRFKSLMDGALKALADDDDDTDDDDPECETCDGEGTIDGKDCETCGGSGTFKAASGLGDPATVAETVAEPTLKAAADCGCAKGDRMTNEQKAGVIKALVECKYSGFTAGDEQMLEGVAPERLEAFKVAADARRTQAAEIKAAEAKPMTEEDFMRNAPAELKSLIARQQRQETELKTSLVASLKAAQEEYGEAELASMSIEALERLARIAKVDAPVDFSGRGIARTASAKDTDVFTNPPDGYAMAAARSRVQ